MNALHNYITPTTHFAGTFSVTEYTHIHIHTHTECGLKASRGCWWAWLIDPAAPICPAFCQKINQLKDAGTTVALGEKSAGIVGNSSCDVELGSSCEELTWPGTTVKLLLFLSLFLSLVSLSVKLLNTFGWLYLMCLMYCIGFNQKYTGTDTDKNTTDCFFFFFFTYEWIKNTQASSNFL